MKYLITGGAGFIGLHIAESLLKRGHNVVIVDNFSSGTYAKLYHIKDNERLSIVNGSILDSVLLMNTFEGIDGVFHQAAKTSVSESIIFPEQTNTVNVTGTLNVLIAAQECGVKNVVVASSAAVYGDDPHLPKKESMLPCPKSPYAVSKIANEYYCSVFSQIRDIRTICLRYFNVFGPRQDPNSEYAAVIPKFIKRILLDQPPIIYGDGNQTRDFIYIQDVVDANILAMNSDECGVFNIAGGNSISLNTLASTISKITKYHSPPIYEDSRTGDIIHSYADISKAKEKLLFAPKYSLEAGLHETIEWYRNSNF
jgi:UDP-glucose 4-epimerase